MLACRMVILNYNGKELLERFLPSVVTAAQASRHPCRVTVLDNQSRDASVAFVRQQFPEVEVVVAPENKVYCSFNAVVERCEEDVVILLNNDMQLERAFVDPLARVFEEHLDAFLAATQGDRAVAQLRWGLVGASFAYPGYDELAGSPGMTFSAGVGAFDRKKFLELGGYDELYLPGLYEDVDLCYRGWQRGWRGYYCPESKKFHVGSASFKRAFSAAYRQRLAFRNSVLFMVKNITDPWLFASFVLMLALRVLSAPFVGQWFVWPGLAEAMTKFPKAWRVRRAIQANGSVNDREVLKRINAAVLART